MDWIGQQLGNYRLTRLLGQGGFAEVYLGEHVHLGTQAAIKVLQGRMSAQDLRDFTEEARTIAGLKHPCILRVLDFGIEGTTPFLVMDYAPKGTLRDRHPRGTPLPIATILPYVKQLAAALQYAHNQKLVHRDVKPENMLVDSNNTILLSDFGIATAAHKTQSLSTQEAIGTVTYMAPEQIKGKARPASDQYSLAVVVYEWLCGTTPFDGSTSIEIAMRHLTEAPPLLQSKISTISPAVGQVVLRALSKDPQQRFSTITEFADTLERVSQPMVAMRDSPIPSYFPPKAPVVAPLSPPNFPPTRSSKEPRPLIPLLGLLAVITVASGLIYFASSYRAPSGSNPNYTYTPPPTQQQTTRSANSTSPVELWVGTVRYDGGSSPTTLKIMSIYVTNKVFSGTSIGHVGDGPGQEIPVTGGWGLQSQLPSDVQPKARSLTGAGSASIIVYYRGPGGPRNVNNNQICQDCISIGVLQVATITGLWFWGPSEGDSQGGSFDITLNNKSTTQLGS